MHTQDDNSSYTPELCRICHQNPRETHRTICRSCRYQKSKGEVSEPPSSSQSLEQKQSGNTLRVEGKGARIKTLEDLLQVGEVDKEKWKVDHHTLNTWEVAASDGEGNFTLQTLHQVKATLSKQELSPTKFEPISPTRFELPNNGGKLTLLKPKSDFSTALILPDSQHGFVRRENIGNRGNRGKHGENLIPFHDRDALEVALQVAKQLQPDHIILLGDMIDLPDWSIKYLRSPDMKQTSQAAINELSLYLTLLREACPNARISYLEGNHEARMRDALKANLEAAYGLKRATPFHQSTHPLLSLPYLLGLDELGVEYLSPYPNGSLWLSSNLKIIHGEVVRGKGGDTAKAYLRDSDYSIIYGHIHRMELASRTKERREGHTTITAASPGTLARIDKDTPIPKVKSFMDWQQGIAIAHYSPSQPQHQINLLPINDGKLLHNGQLFQGVGDRLRV